MTNKEKNALKIVIDTLENLYKFHNRNLTKKQYYAIEDCVESLKYIADRKYPLFGGQIEFASKNK